MRFLPKNVKESFAFRVSNPDKIVFNHEVYTDFMSIEPRSYLPVLYIVERGMHFSAERFCCNFGFATSFVNHKFPRTCVVVHENSDHADNVDRSTCISTPRRHRMCNNGAFE